MHKLIYVLKFILFITISTYSSAQNLKKISKSDTLFVFFEKTYNKEIKGVFKIKENCESRSYVFKFQDSTVVALNPSFYFDCQTRAFIKRNNKILKKKRKIIINYNFYLKNRNKLSKTFYTRKPTFIIDKDEIDKDELILRQVNFLELFNQQSVE